MLLKLAKDKKHKELAANEWFFCVSEFQTLTNRQAEFVALMADFESPIPKLPDNKERRKLAALHCGCGTRSDRNMVLDTRGLDLVHGKVEVVEKAIIKYQEIQRQTNEDYRMLEFLTNRVEHLKKITEEKSEDLADEKIKTALTKELFELYEKKREFEKKMGKASDPNVVGEADAEPDDGGDRKLSLIDKVNMENKDI